MKKIKVVKMWASWCGPCRMYNPVFQKVTEENKNENIEFSDVDIENDPNNLKVVYGISSIPFTVIVDEDGQVLRKKAGYMREEQLLNFINE